MPIDMKVLKNEFGNLAYSVYDYTRKPVVQHAAKITIAVRSSVPVGSRKGKRRGKKGYGPLKPSIRLEVDKYQARVTAVYYAYFLEHGWTTAGSRKNRKVRINGRLKREMTVQIGMRKRSKYGGFYTPVKRVAVKSAIRRTKVDGKQYFKRQMDADRPSFEADMERALKSWYESVGR